MPTDTQIFLRNKAKRIQLKFMISGLPQQFRLGLCTSNAEASDWTSKQGPRSHVLQLRVHLQQLKDSTVPHSKEECPGYCTKTWCRQRNAKNHSTVHLKHFHTLIQITYQSKEENNILHSMLFFILMSSTVLAQSPISPTVSSVPLPTVCYLL